MQFSKEGKFLYVCLEQACAIEVYEYIDDDGMPEFNKTQQRYRWPYIEAALKERIGENRTSALFDRAISLGRQFEERYGDIKGYERTHVSAACNIAAIYIPLRDEIGSEEAISLLDEVWKPGALAKKAKLDRLPPKIFMVLCRKIAKTMFGNKAGFEQEDISKDRTEVRFNVHACPYVRIMKELGCSEACPIVCRQDEYSYGDMRAIAFERTKTIGRGDELCDFCYRLKRKEEL